MSLMARETFKTFYCPTVVITQFGQFLMTFEIDFKLGLKEMLHWIMSMIIQPSKLTIPGRLFVNLVICQPAVRTREKQRNPIIMCVTVLGRNVK